MSIWAHSKGATRSHLARTLAAGVYLLGEHSFVGISSALWLAPIRANLHSEIFGPSRIADCFGALALTLYSFQGSCRRGCSALLTVRIVAPAEQFVNDESVNKILQFVTFCLTYTRDLISRKTEQSFMYRWCIYSYAR